MGELADETTTEHCGSRCEETQLQREPNQSVRCKERGGRDKLGWQMGGCRGFGGERWGPGLNSAQCEMKVSGGVREKESRTGAKEARKTSLQENTSGPNHP